MPKRITVTKEDIVRLRNEGYKLGVCNCTLYISGATTHCIAFAPGERGPYVCPDCNTEVNVE